MAPCPGAELREVVNVGIVDCPPDYNQYSVYMPGEFILTNLGFAYADPALAERSLLALIGRGVSAIAVKRVYEAPISERVRKESAAAGVPVYQYDGAYHERVAYESLDLIERDREDAGRVRLIEGLLDDHDGDAVRKGLYELTGALGTTVQCFALTSGGRDALSLYAARDAIEKALLELREGHPVIDSVAACRYRDVALVFVSYSEDGTEAAREARFRCEDLIALEGTVLCGEGCTVSFSDGDLTVRQAMAALEHARMDGERVVRWEDAGLKAFADASRQDRLFTSVSSHYRLLLEQDDEERGGELLQTAESLCRNHGDVRAAAEELYQHPNTIRYRMKKMKRLMGIENESDALLNSLLLLSFLPFGK